MSSPRQEPLARIVLHELGAAAVSLARSPRYAVPAFASLALGLAATAAVFALFVAAVLRPLPFREPDALVEVTLGSSTGTDDPAPLSVPLLRRFESLPSAFASVAAYRAAPATLVARGEPRHVRATRVTSSFFSTLGIEAAAGRTIDAPGASPDGAHVAVVSHAFWRSALGGGNALGRDIVVNAETYTIVGVARPAETFPAGTDVWLPLRFGADEETNPRNCGLDAVARLRPGASLVEASHALEADAGASHFTWADGSAIVGRVRPLRDVLLGDTASTAKLMFAAVIVFLLLACTNVASLMLTRASVRAHDFGVRLALGASPASIARAALLEGLVLAAAGCAAGLALARLAIDVASRAFEGSLGYAPPAFDRSVVALGVSLSLVCVLFVALGPALRAMKIRPMNALRGAARASSDRGAKRVREVLVAAQVAATVVLLLSAGLLTRSLEKLTRVPLGFDPRGAAMARVALPGSAYGRPDAIRQFAHSVVERLESAPGVEAAAIASNAPLDPESEEGVGVRLDGGGSSAEVFAEERHVSPGYFHVVGTALLAGRDFNPADGITSRAVAIVNDDFARTYFRTASPLGRTFSRGERDAKGKPIWITVVGVAQDAHDRRPDVPVRPTFFLPFEQAPLPSDPAAVPEAVILARTGRDSGLAPVSLLGSVRAAVRATDGALAVYGATTLSDAVAESYASRRALERLLVAFACAAMLLAGVGLYGVTAYSVAQRSLEMAVRRAFGASTRRIVGMILVETGLVVVLGLAVGVGVTLYARPFLDSFLFAISTSDVPTYAAVCAATGLFAALSALVPAWRAASVPPLESVRAV